MRIIKEVNTKYLRLSLEIQTKSVQSHSIFTEFPAAIELAIDDIQDYTRKRFRDLENIYKEDFKPEFKLDDEK